MFLRDLTTAAGAGSCIRQVCLLKWSRMMMGNCHSVTHSPPLKIKTAASGRTQLKVQRAGTCACSRGGRILRAQIAPKCVSSITCFQHICCVASGFAHHSSAPRRRKGGRRGGDFIQSKSSESRGRCAHVLRDK